MWRLSRRLKSPRRTPLIQLSPRCCPVGASGWRAAGPGTQTIRLLFTQPQRLRRIWLQLRGDPHGAHARVRLALVGGWRAVVPGNRAAAVELQSPRHNLRDGRSSRRAPGGHGARVEHHSGHQRGKCVRFFGAVAACLTPRATGPPNHVAVGYPDSGLEFTGLTPEQQTAGVPSALPPHVTGVP